MPDFYGTAAAVRLRTGVDPADLGLEDDAALDDAIEDLLAEATDLADRFMRSSYLTGTVPAGLDGIVSDMTADALGSYVARRQTPVVRIDDFVVRSITSTMLTKDVRARLRVYGSSAAGEITVTADLRAMATTLTAADLDTMDLDAP